jgi:hypothetical protein
MSVMRAPAILLVALAACGSSDRSKTLEAFATEMCACTEQTCFDSIKARMKAKQAEFADGPTAGEQEAYKHFMECYDKMNAAVRKPDGLGTGAAVSVDAGVVVAVDAAGSAQVATPPPGPPPPKGIGAAELAKLDAMMVTLDDLKVSVLAAGSCKEAARAVTAHWKGFKPVGQVLAEVNPKDDQVITKWLTETYFRRAFGAVGTLVNKGIEGCDKDADWNRATEASDFIGIKKKRR